MSSEDVVIRSIGLRDLTTVQNLFELAVVDGGDPTEQLHDNIDMVRWQMKRVRQQLFADEVYIGYIAEQGDEAIGYIAIVLIEHGSVFAINVFAEVQELFVVASHRGGTIEQRLLEAALATVESLGVRHVVFDVPVQATAQIGLLDSKGFEAKSTRMILEVGTASPDSTGD